MDTKALRQKILDLAIRGKLVPQDPNDEPASVLLDRIRAEKQQMVKDGKLKAKDIKNDTIIFKGEDNLHYEKFADGTVKCIEDEIPFELPEGWEWTRLGVISSSIQYGLSNPAESNGTHRLLRITDIQDGKVVWENVPFTTADDSETYLLQKGDIVFARTGATVGKSFLIDKLPYESVYASYLIRIRLLDNISAEYLYHFFNSYCYWQQITNKSVGVGQPNCNGTALKELYIPLPPTLEQLRIVPTVDSILEHASIIELEKLSLKEMLVQTRSKILDLAIRGKLVPQDSNDEPASALLERIRTEKEELIKQGKIKRDKNESVIFRGEDNSYYEKIGDKVRCIDDEMPFELPDGWEFARLSNICNINPRNNIDDELITSFVPMSFIGNGFSNTFSFDKRKWKEIKNGFTHFAENDIGFAKITPCFENRKSVVFRDLCNGYGAGTTELFILRPYCNVIKPNYLLYLIKSEKFINNGKQTFSGAVGQQRVGKEYVLNYVCPIPPLAEQIRIANKVLLLLETFDGIEKSLS